MLVNQISRNVLGGWRMQRGAGLIEVLIAVLVLSFGMLGLAGLQMSALKNNQSSLERGAAIMQAHAIADSMRADRAKAESEEFDIELTEDAPTGTSFPERALAAWRTNLTAALGQGATGSVDCDGARCEIVIEWSEERVTGTANAKQQLSTEVRL